MLKEAQFLLISERFRLPSRSLYGDYSVVNYRKMKNIFFAALAIIMTTQTMGAQDNAEMSYSLGVIVAQNLKKQGITDLDGDKFAKAIKDVLAGNALEISFEDADSIFQDYSKKQQEMAHVGNKTAGEEFLATNGARSEVSTTASGLQYEVITEGTGAKPSLLDKVNVHYHGTLITGETFDSSVDRGEPISFPLNGVIVGWQEGLQLMTVGSKYKFYIPYNLAYGERAAGAAIKPFSALVFEVELLGIE